jgi:hypothetical protein
MQSKTVVPPQGETQLCGFKGEVLIFDFLSLILHLVNSAKSLFLAKAKRRRNRVRTSIREGHTLRGLAPGSSVQKPGIFAHRRVGFGFGFLSDRNCLGVYGLIKRAGFNCSNESLNDADYRLRLSHDFRAGSGVSLLVCLNFPGILRLKSSRNRLCLKSSA